MRPTPRGLRRVLPWVALLVIGATWWMTLAPTAIGGASTEVIVRGTSMQPLLQPGDLVVAHRAATYRRGDLVVFLATSGTSTGYVVHRLVSGSTEHGWHTKGDNNPWVDPWLVESHNIVGRYVARLPHVGSALATVTTKPLISAACIAVVVGVAYWPRRRRRVTEQLARELATAHREPVRSARFATIVMALAAFTLAVCMFSLVRLVRMAHAPTAVMMITGFAALWSAVVFLIVARRLSSVRSVTSVDRARMLLADRLFLVHQEPVVASSAVEVSLDRLCQLAEIGRIPVLHHRNAVIDADSFWLLTADRGNFCVHVCTRHQSVASASCRALVASNECEATSVAAMIDSR